MNTVPFLSKGIFRYITKYHGIFCFISREGTYFWLFLATIFRVIRMHYSGTFMPYKGLPPDLMFGKRVLH